MFNKINRLILAFLVVCVIQAQNPASAFNFKFPFFKKNKAKQETKIPENIEPAPIQPDLTEETPVLDDTADENAETPAVNTEEYIDEGDWDEYGEEDERRRHHRPGDVLHGLYRSGLRVTLVAFHKELDAFDDDDGVVDDRTYNEDESEERKRVDGVADREQRGEGAEQRDRYRDRRDERRAPVLKEEVADEYDERERHEERYDDFLNRLLNVLGRVVLHFELHVVGQVRAYLLHNLADAGHDVEGVRAGGLRHSYHSGRGVVDVRVEVVGLGAELYARDILQLD